MVPNLDLTRSSRHGGSFFSQGFVALALFVKIVGAELENCRLKAQEKVAQEIQPAARSSTVPIVAPLRSGSQLGVHCKSTSVDNLSIHGNRANNLQDRISSAQFRSLTKTLHRKHGILIRNQPGTRFDT
jgi:hypothetical protein